MSDVAPLLLCIMVEIVANTKQVPVNGNGFWVEGCKGQNGEGGVGDGT